MAQQQHKKILIALIGISLVAAGWTLARRVSVENANRKVGIAVDYNRAQELAGLTGLTTAEVLGRLGKAGATHVAVREEALSDLLSEEKLQLTQTTDGVVITVRADARERVGRQLTLRMPGVKRLAGGALVFDSRSTLDMLRPIGLGYPERAIEDVREAGLKVLARPVGEMTLTKQSIDAAIEATKVAGADTIVFAGLQVFGVTDLIKYAGEKMTQAGLRYGYIELTKQFGDAALAGAVKHQIIRCHAVPAAEMVKLAPQRAVDRYALAVHERNVRLCYVRPYLLGSDDLAAAAEEHIADIVSAIKSGGYTPGDPICFEPVSVSRPQLILLLIGVGAGLIWLIDLVFSLPRSAFMWLVVAVAAGSALAAFAAAGLAQHLGAFAAAIVFPVLGMLSVQMREPGMRPRLWRGISLFVRISLVSLTGGLIAAACLSDLPHMMQLALFRGTKLAQLAPLLIVLAAFVARCTQSYQDVRTETGEAMSEWPALRAGLSEAASAAVRYWHVGLIVVGLAVAAVLLMRSGNVSPLPPSELELQVRESLKDWLVIRPRNKEIFLGHPAMVITLAFLLAGWRRGMWVGMVIGAIGQISLVNTFGHLHTPLVISLLRVLNGLWIGCIAASVLWLVFFYGLALCRRAGWRIGDPTGAG